MSLSSEGESEEEPKTGLKPNEKKGKVEQIKEQSKEEEEDEFSKFLKIQSTVDKKRKASLADSFNKTGSNSK